MSEHEDLIAIAVQCGAEKCNNAGTLLMMSPSNLVALERAILARAAKDVEPVLCVSSKAFGRLRAGDEHCKAWLPPTTEAEDMPLYSASTVATQSARIAELEAQLLALKPFTDFDV